MVKLVTEKHANIEFRKVQMKNLRNVFTGKKKKKKKSASDVRF